MTAERDEHYLRIGRAVSTGYSEVALRLIHSDLHSDHDWLVCPERTEWEKRAVQLGNLLGDYDY